MRAPLLCGLLLVGAVALAQDDSAPAQAAAPAPRPLRYGFDRLAGQTAVYTVETELGQSVIHGGEEKAQGARWRRDTFEQRYRRKGGGGQVAQKRTRVELRVESPGQNPVSFDSGSDDEPPEGLTVDTGILDRTVTISMNRRGEVSKVRGARNPVERNGYAASFLRFPEEPLTVGGAWRRPSPQRVPYPPFGTLVYHTRYRVDELRPDGSVLVTATIDVLFEPAAPDPAKPDPPRVKISKQEAGGTLLLRADGLLLESQFRSVLEITIDDGTTTRVEKATSTTVQRLKSVRSKRS